MKMLNRSPKVLVPVAILAASVLTFGYLKVTRTEAQPKPPEERVWPVSVTAVERISMQPTVSAFGEVVAGKEVEIKPLVPGRLVEVSPNLENGAVVQAGELLVVVDPFDYETAVVEREAELNEANARLQEIGAELKAARQLRIHTQQELVLRERDLERTRNLTIRGTASEKARDDAELALNNAEQSLTLREQSIAQLGARTDQQDALISRADVALRRARRDLEHTRVTAPFTGFLTDTDAALGKRVRDGDAVARLIDANRLEISFQLNNRDFARLLNAGTAGANGLVNRPVEVQWKVGNEVFVYQAQIERVGAEIDATSGGVDVYAVVEGAGPEVPLRPGAFVQVAIPDRHYQDVVELPDTAVDDTGSLYVVEDGRLVARQVTILRRVGTTFLVTGDLPAGALVVTTPFPEAGPGARVSVR